MTKYIEQVLWLSMSGRHTLSDSDSHAHPTGDVGPRRKNHLSHSHRHNHNVTLWQHQTMSSRTVEPPEISEIEKSAIMTNSLDTENWFDSMDPNCNYIAHLAPINTRDPSRSRNLHLNLNSGTRAGTNHSYGMNWANNPLGKRTTAAGIEFEFFLSPWPPGSKFRSFSMRTWERHWSK